MWLRVFIWICLRHCERNSCQNVKTFLLSSGFLAKIVSHIWRAKAKICSTFAFDFFSNFEHLFDPFNSIFYFHFKNTNFFEIWPKLTLLRCFFRGTIFSVEEFLLSEKMVTKMWRYCEKNSDVIWYCESQCERNSSHIVTHIVKRLWVNCEWRWIPLLFEWHHQKLWLSPFAKLTLKNSGHR